MSEALTHATEIATQLQKRLIGLATKSICHLSIASLGKRTKIYDTADERFREGRFVHGRWRPSRAVIHLSSLIFILSVLFGCSSLTVYLFKMFRNEISEKRSAQRTDIRFPFSLIKDL